MKTIKQLAEEWGVTEDEVKRRYHEWHNATCEYCSEKFKTLDLRVDQTQLRCPCTKDNPFDPMCPLHGKPRKCEHPKWGRVEQHCAVVDGWHEHCTTCDSFRSVRPTPPEPMPGIEGTYEVIIKKK